VSVNINNKLDNLKILSNYLEKIPFNIYNEYFLFEEKFMKIIDPSLHKIKNLNFVDSNIEVKAQYDKIVKSESANKELKYLLWSGNDVLETKNSSQINYFDNLLMEKIEKSNFELLSEGFLGYYEMLSFNLKNLCTSVGFMYFMVVIIILNSILLSLAGNLISNEAHIQLNKLEIMFNSIYILEFVI